MEQFTTRSNDEWYTPVEIIKAARGTMTHIDLDPASCTAANFFVQAKRFFDKDLNGLHQVWNSSAVWLNPPFKRENGSGASVIAQWTEKLIQEYDSGNVKQACLLVPTQTNAKWYKELYRFPQCAMYKRVAFLKPDSTGHVRPDSRTTHMLGTAIFFLGDDLNRFYMHFHTMGEILFSLQQQQKLMKNLA